MNTREQQRLSKLVETAREWNEKVIFGQQGTVELVTALADAIESLADEFLSVSPATAWDEGAEVLTNEYHFRKIGKVRRWTDEYGDHDDEYILSDRQGGFSTGEIEGYVYEVRFAEEVSTPWIKGVPGAPMKVPAPTLSPYRSPATTKGNTDE